MQFHDSTKQYPMLRNAMVLANLSSPKVEDGIAKLLSKSDVTKIASKAQASKATACENALCQAAGIASYLAGYGKLLADQELGPVGRLWVRVALHAADKGKSGPDGRTMPLSEVKTAFLQELSNVVGYNVVYDKWSDAGAAADEAPDQQEADEQPAKRSKAASLEDHSNPTWIAAQKGYSLGTLVYRRQEDGSPLRPEKLHVVTVVGEKVKLHVACDYKLTNKEPCLEVALDELFSKWVIFKGDVPRHFHTGQHRPMNWSLDVVRADLFRALHAADHDMSSFELKFFRKPDVVLTTCKIGKGKLVLLPMAPLANIVTKSSTGTLSLGKHKTAHGPTEFFVHPPPRPTMAKKSLDADCEQGLVAYWWVYTLGAKESGDEANMFPTTVSHNGITVPALANTNGPIGAHVKLVQQRKGAPAAKPAS